METGITLEEVDFKMAYGIVVYGGNHCDEDGCIDYDPDVIDPWKRYVDVKLLYRWWITAVDYFDLATEEVPTHECGDFT